MCVIIAKPAGVDPLKDEYFENAWNHNGDGGGIVWKEKGKAVTMQKGFMKKDEFLAKICELNKKDTAFIAHFRIKSVGVVSPENTHPFAMKRVTFAHNGTISSIKPLDGKTDSETFGLWFLGTRTMKWIKDNALLLELALGTSKFALMDNKTGEIFILNKEYGQERDGAWFSNTSAFPIVKTAPTTNYYSGYRQSPYYDDYAFPSSSLPIKSNKLFGTNGFLFAWGEYSKDEGCWVYKSTHSPVWSHGIGGNIVVSRRGFLKLNKMIEPNKDLPEIDKKEVRQVNKTLGYYTSRFCKMLKDYYKSSFQYEMDKEDEEDEISALYTVLDAVRRLVKANKAVTIESLDDFLLSHLPKTGQFSNRAPEYAVYVDGFVSDFLDDLIPDTNLRQQLPLNIK